jgi:hypothetical protein
MYTSALTIPAEQWNRLGTRLIPKMRAPGTLTAAIRLETEVDPARIAALLTELQQIIDEMGVSASMRVERANSHRPILSTARVIEGSTYSCMYSSMLIHFGQFTAKIHSRNLEIIIR